MRRTPFVPVIVALLLAVPGCGGEEKKDTPIGPLGDDADTSSTAPSPDSTTAPSAEPTPFDDKGNEAIRGTVEASTSEQQAIADAWFAYWDVRVNSYFKAEVDPKLGTVAAGEAAADVVRYVTYLKGKRLHTVGDTKFGVSDIVVRGATATLTSCGVNKSVDRSADGSPAEQLTPFYNLAGALSKAAGKWRVVEAEAVGNNGCRA